MKWVSVKFVMILFDVGSAIINVRQFCDTADKNTFCGQFVCGCRACSLEFTSTLHPTDTDSHSAFCRLLKTYLFTVSD